MDEFLSGEHQETVTNLSTTLACGAGDRTRTDDILLGKQTLYQLSYTRNGPQYKPVGRTRPDSTQPLLLWKAKNRFGLSQASLGTG